MSRPDRESQRTVGLLGATGVGVGAIVGGGIMVLAGAAYAATGPAALVAFALNGVVAFVTAMSFAEMSAAFPQSGGAYNFAKKVLSVRAAFAAGWVLWFAYIVAAVLYALGFAAFAALALKELWAALGGDPPAWLEGRGALLFLATMATAIYTATLIRKSTGGGQWATVGKIVVFTAIILAGIVALVRQPLDQTGDALTPFFTGGASGLFITMGLTFIAVQGFDLIAAIGGEVKAPGKTIPRAMFLSLGIAMIVYLPLLFVVAVVGVEPGESIDALAAARGDTVFAFAVSRFMGTTGYWLVIVAAILSTLSALHSNILAASRVALSMAHDRTLPAVLDTYHATRQTPIMALYASALTIIAIIFMIPDVGAAGAAASLIFLISFALTHVTAYLARTRGGTVQALYQTPYFPFVPIAGGLACGALAVFQAFMVPAAGSIALMWLGLGVILYMALFKPKAETADASAEARDPALAKLRGKNPLVLVPIANPAHARSMVEVANAMAPTEFARVLLLSIVSAPKGSDQAGILAKLDDAQRVMREALAASYGAGHAPEALITAAVDPWEEIRRVAHGHDCQSLLLGIGAGAGAQEAFSTQADALLNQIDCDVAFMRAPVDWHLDQAVRVLVPVGGRGNEHELRARVLGSICRTTARQVTFVTVLPAASSDARAEEVRRSILDIADVHVPDRSTVTVLRHDDPVAALLDEARNHDLMILGLQSSRWRKKIFGQIALRMAREAPCATIMVSNRRPLAYSELYRPLRHAVQGMPWRSSGTTRS
jgi:basic amino acid/polyamine antiporter, APA family